MVSNIQEIKSRSGKIIAVVTKGDTQVKALADHVIEIPETNEPFTPLLTTIPLQLLSSITLQFLEVVMLINLRFNEIVTVE